MVLLYCTKPQRSNVPMMRKCVVVHVKYTVLTFWYNNQQIIKSVSEIMFYIDMEFKWTVLKPETNYI